MQLSRCARPAGHGVAAKRNRARRSAILCCYPEIVAGTAAPDRTSCVALDLRLEAYKTRLVTNWTDQPVGHETNLCHAVPYWARPSRTSSCRDRTRSVSLVYWRPGSWSASGVELHGPCPESVCERPRHQLARRATTTGSTHRSARLRTIRADSLSISANAAAAVACSLISVASRVRCRPRGGLFGTDQACRRQSRSVAVRMTAGRLPWDRRR